MCFLRCAPLRSPLAVGLSGKLGGTTKRSGLTAARIKGRIRDGASNILFWTQLYRVIRFLQNLSQRRRNLAIVVYHKVNDDHEKGTQIRPHVRGTSPGIFARQMKYLRKRQTVVPLEDAVMAMRNGRALPKNAVAITFDDGYLDNYRHAFPILRRYGLPATFFLTTGFIGSRKPAWEVALSAYLRLSPLRTVAVDCFDTALERFAEEGRELLSGRESSLADAPTPVVLQAILRRLDPVKIERLVDESISEPAQPCMELPLATARERAKARQILTAKLRDRPWHERELLLEILRVRLGLKAAIYVPCGDMMTWEMIKEMARDGMAFGAHTCSHPILTRVPIAVAEKELIRSKRRLEAVLGCPATLFCYPNGKKGDFDSKTVACLKKAGFAAACSMLAGTNNGQANLFELRRLGPETSIAVFAMKASGFLR
jgi:peptidoglycan/xylan/chitin deacetylase (PgdA/CDA1 family)